MLIERVPDALHRRQAATSRARIHADGDFGPLISRREANASLRPQRDKSSLRLYTSSSTRRESTRTAPRENHGARRRSTTAVRGHAQCPQIDHGAASETPHHEHP